MSQEELLEIVNCIKDVNRPEPVKKSLLSPDNLIKFGLYILVVGIFYGTYKADNAYQMRALDRIEKSQNEEKLKTDLKFDVLTLQVHTCQTQIATMDVQLKDMKENDALKK